MTHPRFDFMMHDNSEALYAAYASRDSRFDGVFFVGVTSTGIYCRPVCTARTPSRSNCRFFTSAAAAEQAEFRPCLRCRPELAPGNAVVDGSRRVADRIAYRIGEGLFDDRKGLESIAAEFHLSSRQMRRIVQQELGVSPIELVLTRRLLLAKQLLTETDLPVIDVAYASGFSSLRRFNDAFRSRYRMPPTQLRKDAARRVRAPASGEGIKVQLTYRPPFDWAGSMDFLSVRALSGVESVEEGSYSRTVRLGTHAGWVHVRHTPQKRAIEVELALTLVPVLPALLSRIRHLFDLSARPDLIGAQLGRDERLAAAVAENPGLRVPGAFDGFELAVRAILGQQVTVKGAATLAGRFAAAFGEAIDTPHARFTHLTPVAERIACIGVADLTALGIIRSRAASIIALAEEVSAGRLKLVPGADSSEMARQLVALPGIGPWTAEYIAMRALSWPDAFPKEDIAIRNRLGGVTSAQAEAISQAWRPWRSYATAYLWRSQSRSMSLR